ncbi:MAG: hypothetical protein EOQ50_20235 [Mesorhizobium sp.]|nr:MAG: hypothetical protein EOQ50_20235 [Mesorhizobium sp.]
MKNRISLLLTATVVAIGCQVSVAAKKHTDASPANTELAKCIASARVWDITFKHELASFMGVSLDRVPATFCQRIIEGVRTGRISFSDVNAIQLSQPTEIWMDIKGKPKRPPVTHSLPPQSSRFRNCSGIDGSFQVPISQKCPLSGWANH